MTDVVDRLMAKRLGVLPDWAEALMTEAANEILAWRNELSAVMPRDFKDWFENSPNEWPAIAAKIISDTRAELEMLES